MGFTEKTFLDKSNKDYFFQKREVGIILKLRNKPYTLDLKHLIGMCSRCYNHSIEEFAMNYCFAYFILHPQLDSTILKEAMFIEIVEYFNKNKRLFVKAK